MFVARNGQVVAVGVGDSGTVSLEDFSLKRSDKRFQGVRCVHTHPKGSGKLSDMDTSALTSMRLDAMIAVGVLHGRVNDVEVAFINGKKIDRFYFKSAAKIDDADMIQKITEYERKSVIPDVVDNTPETRGAILVNVGTGSDLDVEIEELKRLADTMGLDVKARLSKNKIPTRAIALGLANLKKSNASCRWKMRNSSFSTICSREVN